MLHDLSHGEARRASLEDYLSAIQKRKLLVIGCVLGGFLVAYLLTQLQTKTYTATARVVVSPTPVGSVNANLSAPNLDRESEVIVSDPIARSAVALLPESADPLLLRRQVEAQFEPGSDVIRVSFTDESPEFAANVANAFADAYVAARTGQQESYYSARTEALAVEIRSIDEELGSLSQRITELDSARLVALSLPATDPNRQAQVSAVDAERNTLITERNAALSQRRSAVSKQQTEIGNSQSQIEAASSLRDAGVPSVGNQLSSSIMYFAGGVVGLILGIVAAFLSVRLDRTAGAEKDVELALGAPVISRLPDLGWRARFGSADLVMLSPNRSNRFQSAREAFRRMRSSTKFVVGQRGLKSILVTSSMPGEGKSTTAANLAVTFAQAGDTVVLLNADMRRPTTESMFGIGNEDGLSYYLGGRSEEIHHVRVAGFEDRLIVVPAGPPPSNPGELLASARFGDLIEEMTQSVDLVIVDSPPINAAADALAVGVATDGAMVVVDGKTTSIPELLAVRRDAENGGMNIVAAVLNRDTTNLTRGWRGRRNRYAYAREDRSLFGGSQSGDGVDDAELAEIS